MTSGPAAVRPPAIARARREYLAVFLLRFRMHPRDTGRLRVWEFWDLIATCEHLAAKEAAARG